MPTKLVLGPGGSLSLYRWNEELRSECGIVEKFGKWMVKRNGQTVQMGNSREAVEEYFWTEEEIQNVWVRLREPIELLPDTSLKDVYLVIEQYPELHYLVDSLFPGYRFGMDYPESVYEENIQLRREGVVRKGRLTVSPACNVEACVMLEDLPLQPYNFIEVEGEDDVLYAQKSMTFLDMLEILFDKYSFYGDVVLRSNGVYHENELIDDPLAVLLSKCELEGTVRLTDVFNFVEQNPDIKSFISMYSWCRPIDEFHKAARNPKESTLSLLEVFHFQMESDLRARDFTGKEFGIDFVDVAELAALPITLNKDIHVEDCVFMRDFTLLDILDAIYWEISFWGNEDDKDEIRTALVRAVDEFKEDYVNV